PASEVAKSEAAANPAAADPAAAAERQKAADEFKKQLDQQKQKIDSLTHDFDLEQREYRLHSAGSYATDRHRRQEIGSKLRMSACRDGACPVSARSISDSQPSPNRSLICRA